MPGYAAAPQNILDSKRCNCDALKSQAISKPPLYLDYSLDSFTALRRLIGFYVPPHNEVMPHSAFEGQTPDEMFIGTDDEVAPELAAARKTAREKRMEENRAARCSTGTGIMSP